MIDNDDEHCRRRKKKPEVKRSASDGKGAFAPVSSKVCPCDDVCLVMSSLLFYSVTIP